MYQLILSLKVNDGATLKNNKPIQHKTGWQVATEGHKTRNPKQAVKWIKYYNGNCGLWYDGKWYYIDKSLRISTKKQAVILGIEKKQISILRWSDMSLVYLK